MFKAWSTFWANRTRKRREEKLRHSQHIENTFSERLASRSVAGKSSSKIDVGFTSQQTLNQDPEDGERRPTLSRFLRLWKGLRNSTRKAASDEPTRSVVFTIPTEDVFPKAHTRQQTYRQDAVTQTDGFKTHLCEVHRITNDITEDCSHHDLHHLDDELDTICENEVETCQVEATTEISNNESESTETSPALVGGQTNAPDRKTSDEKYLQGKEEGKSFSKESDVDSGCGSSCHEMYATEPQITHAQLNVSSLVYCHAQKTEANEKDKFLDKVSGTPHESKELEKSGSSLTGKIPCETKAQRVPKEQWSEFQKSEAAGDSFEELIKLAKDGMSTLARKRVDDGSKRNKISDCFQATRLVDNICKTRDASTNTDEALSNEKSLDLRTESQLCLDARKVDSGVKSASSASLCLDGRNNIGEILQSEENQSDPSTGKTLLSATTENHMQQSIDKISHCATIGNQSDMPTGKIAHNTTTDKRPDKSTSSAATCLVEIPIIAVDNSLETASENPEPCSTEDSLCHDIQLVNKDQCKQESSQEETNKSCCNNGETTHSSQKAVTFDKPHHMPLRIQESLLNNGQIPEKSSRPKSLVLPSASENNKTGKAVHGLKVPSLETLNLPSQTADHTGRIRSFSATIRRKLSFRERSSPDDTDIEKQGEVEPKSRKLKGFRSFRVNRKKKTKALKSEEISHSTGHLSDSTNYSSTIDKIFHENTGSALFSDVPFTIPEIPEQ
ncbi:Hypothetical predicted protein [Paramuricea clavata]|uniref:Uncharacterized protein n=1 Tax=Paramuricea clavata TaxID=317549 RepID=A0A6S7K6B1_PARCT|nr:Hypothetical predicted protein [Paramuricea clavata]